jgi:hypothetical protein
MMTFSLCALQVGFGFGGVSEVAGGLDNHLSSHRRPVDGRIALGKDLDLLAVNGDEVYSGSDVVMQIAEDQSYLSRCARVAGESDR